MEGSLISQDLPSLPQPGDMLGGVWKVEKMLGRGGMGSVYRCHNRDAPRIKAAIKLLDPAFQHHEGARSRFLREAEILYAIEHPHVVRVSNVDLDATPPFLAMEFVDGVPLGEQLEQRGALAPEVALPRILQLVDALATLHRQRIYHRDIKPQNILICRDGTMKLVDFGLALDAAAPTTPERARFGSVAYAPPEWGGSEPLDPVIWDLYAIGVVLHEMLTGASAFPMAPDKSNAEKLAQVLRDKQLLECLDPGPRCSSALRAIVRRLTHSRPQERFRTARELLEALEDIPSHATPAPSPALPDLAPLPPRQKNKGRPPSNLWILLALGLLGILSVAAGLMTTSLLLVVL